MSTLKVGDKAPGFKLRDQQGQKINLDDFKGKKKLLSFHPLAWTGVCEIQMRTLELKASAFKDLNTVAFGISVDPAPTKTAWAKHLEIEHTLFLSDFWPHGKMSRDYGLFLENSGVSERANIIIDENNTITFIRVYQMKEVPDIEEIIAELQ